MKKNKISIVPWTYGLDEISTIDNIPSDAYGFVYYIEFTDGMKYIGKKCLWSIRTMKPLKNGDKRPGTIDIFYKNTGKGFRQCFHRVKSESDWLSYKGSAEECKNREPANRTILEYAYSALELTYLENRYLFKMDVLADPNYINDNINGTFYRSALDNYARRKQLEEKAILDSFKSDQDEMS